MKKIVLISIGGTIASVSSDPLSTTNYQTKLHARDLLAQLPAAAPADVARIVTDDFMMIDSASLTPEHWLALARRVTEWLTGPENADGVVITHGTDTMEESAYFLNLCIPSGKPVIFTGAMRPASAISADGPLNLWQAILAAASGKLNDCGVMVLMNGVIAAARDVRKINPTRPDAFTPVELGAIGSVTDAKIELNYRPCRKHTLTSRFDCRKIGKLPEVRILYAYAGAPDDVFDHAVSSGAAGIVVAGVGNGNLSTAWKRKIEALPETITVVRCTRTNGFVNRNGSQNDDLLKTVSGGSLSAQKARILLAFALSVTRDRFEIQRIFNEY